jgi:hypothetical protein
MSIEHEPIPENKTQNSHKEPLHPGLVKLAQALGRAAAREDFYSILGSQLDVERSTRGKRKSTKRSR